jgi:hypothetical protein
MLENQREGGRFAQLHSKARRARPGIAPMPGGVMEARHLGARKSKSGQRLDMCFFYFLSLITTAML